MLRLCRKDDRGVAMIAAVGVSMLVGLLLVSVVAITMRESRQTGRERQRSSAVSTAEGEVDRTIATIQSGARESLPCSTTVPRNESVPDSLSVSTTVTYYNGQNALTCEQARAAGTVVTMAKVVATATSAAIQSQVAAQRTMETLLLMKPVYGNGLDKAIFGNTGVNLANRGELYGQDGRPNADLYTNGNFACQNNQHYRGSVMAQGSITLANTCLIDVDAWAKTGFRADNTGVNVLGQVLVSNGNASLVRNAKVGGVVRASGTISWQDCTSSKCFPGSAVPVPPYKAFPILNWDAATQAQWVANGYTILEPALNCNLVGSANGPGQWIMDNASKLTQPTILRTTCANGVIIQQNNKDIALSNHLAVFSKGGVTFSNSITIKSTDATKRNLYLIQPYNDVTIPCNVDGIALNNRVTVESTVDDLLYSPCNVRKANNTDHYGQIYAGGTVQIDNALTMYYRPLPVWGVVGTSDTVVAYTVDILYKRENIVS